MSLIVFKGNIWFWFLKVLNLMLVVTGQMSGGHHTDWDTKPQKHTAASFVVVLCLSSILQLNQNSQTQKTTQRDVVRSRTGTLCWCFVSFCCCFATPCWKFSSLCSFFLTLCCCYALSVIILHLSVISCLFDAVFHLSVVILRLFIAFSGFFVILRLLVAVLRLFVIVWHYPR